MAADAEASSLEAGPDTGAAPALSGAAEVADGGGVGVGDGFGAEVINRKGRGADTEACGSAPQADNTNAKMKNRMILGWDNFMCVFGGREKLPFCIYTFALFFL